jgi:hypothetical protein
MNELMTTQELEQSAVKIQTLQRQAQGILTYCIVEIGQELLEVKAKTEHGAWGQWLEDQVGFSQSTAENYMKIAKEFGDSQTSLFGTEKSETIMSLPYTKVLKLLALPESERDDFLEENDVEAMSTRELEQAIRERDEAKTAYLDEKEHSRMLAEKTEQAIQEAKAAREQAQQLWADLKALENRPMEVAVQAPTKEMLEEIRAAEEKKFQEEREALEKRVQKAEAKAKKQEKKAKALQDAANQATEAARAELQKDMESAREAQKTAEAEKAAAEERAAEAEKKLKLTNTDTAAFQIYFQTVQENFNRMLGVIQKSQPAQAEKYKKAVKALITSIGGVIN